MLKKILSIVGLLCLGTLTGCAGTVGAIESGSSNLDSAMTAPDSGTVTDAAYLGIMQAIPPQPGDTIVILHTNMGDITLRFFPEETPLAYENFVTHARNGYYDGVIFHRVIEEFMIQGGDPQGTGMGGESIWGHGFGPEFSEHLRHFRGAVGMAQSQMPNSIGSQFYIVHSTQIDPNTQEEFQWASENQDEFLGEDLDGTRVYIRDLYSLEMIDAYFRFGGTPFLDLAMNPAGHTVFAQVISGMDVVDAIATVETDGNPPQGSSRPIEEVVIESVTVTTY